MLRTALRISDGWKQYPGRLEETLARVCVTRIAIFAFLLIPLGIAWFWETDREGYLVYFQPKIYMSFLIAGFGINVFYLAFWPRVKNVLLFFRLQLVSDVVLCGILILLTGGIRSGFFFLFAVLVFYYGRLLGFSTAFTASLFMMLIQSGIALMQYLMPYLWNEVFITFKSIVYSLSLQSSAFGLVLLLLRFGRKREEDLLSRLAENERNLREAELLKKRVFDWIESGLVILDREGRIQAINRRAGLLAGVGQCEEMIGRPIGDYFFELEDLWRENKDREGVRRIIERPRGRGWFGVGLTPLPEGMGTLLLFEDLTPLRQLEIQVRTAEKMAAVGELAAGLAHEIKNPLAGIKASLQLIEQDDLNPEHRDRIKRVIRRDVERLDSLLKDFLIFARPSRSAAETVGLYEIIREVTFLIGRNERGIEIILHDSLRGRQWRWSPDNLKQVLLNLLLNAAQAMEKQEGGRIVCEYEKLGQIEAILITDSGPGVDPENVNRLFDPFFTTKNRGTGLGLSIAQRLAGQNNSWIEISNVPDGGARAGIYYNGQAHAD